jgi:hypothetical protein
MSRIRSIAPFTALVVGIVTLGLSLRCSAGDELVVGSVLTGVLAAVWNDNRERGIGDRIAKFLLLIFIVGFSVFIFTVMLYSSRCT